MKFIKYLPAFAVGAKKKSGKLPSKAVLRFAWNLEKLARKFEHKGREDGSSGKPAPDDEAFTSWGLKSFEGDRDFEDVVFLMKEAYMDGYRKGQEVQA